MRHTPLLLVLLIALPFWLGRLPDVPYTWYDEGLNLTAARLLAETGLYGLTSADGIRLSDPAIQTGTPMLALTAVIYNLFGPDLGSARLPVVIFGVLALIAMYALACRMYGRLAGFMTVLLLIAMPGQTTSSFLMLSRQVMGEIPAILCLTCGLLLLVRTRPSPLQTLLAGLLFGIAIVLKSQVLLVLTATIGLWTLVQLLRRDWDALRWMLVGAAMLGVYGVDAVWRSNMAGPVLAENMAILREGFLIHIIPMRAVANLSEMGVLVRLLVAAVAVFGLLALNIRGLRPDSVVSPEADTGVRRVEGFLLLFVVAWMLWFALFSIGWRRYSFVGQVFGMIFLGAVLAYLLGRWQTRRWFYPVMGVLCLAAVCVDNVPRLLQETTGRDFFEMMDYIERDLPPDGLILTWEWSAEYVSDHRFIFPPTTIVNGVTAEQFFNQPYDDTRFNALGACPSYVLFGSFMVDQRVFHEALLAAEPTPVFERGLYRLYRIPEENLERQADGTCVRRTDSG